MYDHWNAFHFDSEVRRTAEDYITAPERSLLFDFLHGWINAEPDHALAMICAVAQITDDGATLDNLAAGPLEDLLCVHGETVLAPIATLARTPAARVPATAWRAKCAGPLLGEVLRLRYTPLRMTELLGGTRP